MIDEKINEIAGAARQGKVGGGENGEKAIETASFRCSDSSVQPGGRDQIKNLSLEIADGGIRLIPSAATSNRKTIGEWRFFGKLRNRVAGCAKNWRHVAPYCGFVRVFPAFLGIFFSMVRRCSRKLT